MSHVSTVVAMLSVKVEVIASRTGPHLDTRIYASHKTTNGRQTIPPAAASKYASEAQGALRAPTAYLHCREGSVQRVTVSRVNSAGYSGEAVAAAEDARPRVPSTVPIWPSCSGRAGVRADCLPGELKET